MEFKIEKGIPVPVNAAQAKYPWRSMEVGDSFIINDYSRENMQAAGNAARIFCSKAKLDWKFTCRKEGDKVRIFRIK